MRGGALRGVPKNGCVGDLVNRDARNTTRVIAKAMFRKLDAWAACG